MIIKVGPNQWRSWMQGVINLDGHAVQTGEEHSALAVPRSTHWMLLARKWGSYLRLPTPAETLNEYRTFWYKTILKVNLGTPRRLASGKLVVHNADGELIWSL